MRAAFNITTPFTYMSHDDYVHFQWLPGLWHLNIGMECAHGSVLVCVCVNIRDYEHSHTHTLCFHRQFNIFITVFLFLSLSSPPILAPPECLIRRRWNVQAALFHKPQVILHGICVKCGLCIRNIGVCMWECCCCRCRECNSAKFTWSDWDAFFIR